MKKYKIFYQENGKLKTLITNSLSSDLPQNIVKIKSISFFSLGKIKSIETLSKKEVLEIFSQINMIISSDIKIQEALKIIIKSSRKRLIKEFLNDILEALNEGKPIYLYLEKYKRFLDPVIIPLFKILEERGSIKMIFSILVNILETRINSKRKFMQTLRYPIFISISFIFSLFLIFTFVVPKFESIFTQYEMKLPTSTIYLLALKDFIINYGIISMLLFSIIVFLSFLLIKNSKKNLFVFDKLFLLYLPIFSKLQKNFELLNFFTALETLLKSKYEFHIALSNASILIKNQFLLDRISTVEENLKSGKSIVKSFEESLVFDDLILSLLNTGEQSNNLELCTSKIKDIYLQNFEKSVKTISGFIEPAFFILISLLILWIMLAIFTPIWGMSSMIN